MKKYIAFILCITLLLTTLTGITISPISTTAASDEEFEVINDLEIDIETSGTEIVSYSKTGFTVDASNVKNPYLRASIYVSRPEYETVVWATGDKGKDSGFWFHGSNIVLSYDTHNVEEDCVAYTTESTTAFDLNYRDMNNPIDISEMEYLEFDVYLPAADCFSNTSHAVTLYLSSSDWVTDKTALVNTVLRTLSVTEGWNHIKLPLSAFMPGSNNTNAFDPTKLTYMRLHVAGMEEAVRTVKMDNICFTKQVEGDGTLNGFWGSDGEIEITSSGGCDNQELHWLTNSLNLKPGWNTIYLPFDTGIPKGTEEFNISNINYFRFYQLIDDSTETSTLKIKDVAIVSKISSLKLHSLYGDEMLFQQNKPVVLSGTCDIGHTITASLKEQNGSTVTTASCVVDSTGEWELSLSGMPGGYTEYDIIFADNGVAAGSLQDIVFGELWLAAGQSNMEFYMKVTPSAQEILANSTDEYLKILYTPHNPASGSASGNVPYDPQTTINGAVWSDATNTAILKESSAVAYYFAAELRKELDIPVGFINVAQGATSIYGWLSREAIEGNTEVLSYLEEKGLYKDESNWNTAEAKNYQQMTGMFNQKVAPLTRFSIAGTIWYQGENEIGNAEGTYAQALELLIKEYSDIFGFEESKMPFIFSHLAPHYYGGLALDRQGEFSAELDSVWRNHQETAAQIAIYDIPLDYDYTVEIEGTANENAIHPMVKEPVGKRMAYAALGMCYKKYEESTSPVYTDVTVDGNSLLIKFDHVADGLAAVTLDDTNCASDNSILLDGFAICGADGIYLPAKASIESEDTIRVTNSTIDYPIGVSYAYTSMSTTSNLVSTRDGQVLFAAVPFCTQRIDEENFYHPVEWLSTEHLTQWRSNGTTADYYSTWRDGTLNANTVTGISLSSETKTEGASSVKFDVKTSQYWAFGISPNIFSTGTTLFSDIDTSIAKYDTLTFDIKQETGKALNFNLQIRNSADNLWYKPYLIGNDGVTGGYTLALDSTSDWQTVTVDLTNLQQGSNAASIDKITKIMNIEFTFGASIGANATSTIYFDNFQLGFKEDKAEINKQSVLTSVKAAEKINALLYTKSTRTVLYSTLEEANTVLATASATQDASNLAASDLQNAMNALWLIGDCDKNKKVDADDLAYLRELLVGSINEENEAADANESEEVDICDLVRVKKIIAR